eukprot:scaffold14479_cov68-Phaeocystis_antarctica.AAC.2
MNKTRFEDPVHDPVAVHDPDRCVRDCLSVTCASVGGLWDTASGTYFPGGSPCGGVAICLAGQNGTEADGDAAARTGYWEVSAENNSAENKLSETVSVLLAVVVTATVSLLLGCGGGLKLVMMRGSKLPLSSGKARTLISEISIQGIKGIEGMQGESGPGIWARSSCSAARAMTARGRCKSE